MELKNYLDRYIKSLFDGSVDGNLALNYLVGTRGLDEPTIRDVCIGYCPQGCEVPGDDDQQRKENSVLKGRVIVPIMDEFDDILALAGRPLTAATSKKWWNQRFDKGNHIFLFNKSRRHAYEKDKIYLVEGYFDAIVPWQYGLRNIGCLMGTSLGMRRIGLISRYCENVCIMFDTDEPKPGMEGAGQMAQRRAIAELALAGVKGISKINLPMKVDPDMFVVSHGVDALLALEEKVHIKEQKEAVREYRDNRNR